MGRYQTVDHGTVGGGGGGGGRALACMPSQQTGPA